MKILYFIERGQEHVGRWLESYDNTSEDDHGYGVLTLTEDAATAKVFRDITEAWNFWGQVSKTVPVRWDGKPNRPLTAFTIEVQNAPHLG